MWPPDPNPESKPKQVLLSDVRDDWCQQHVLTNLQQLGDSRGEVMFVLSQLNFTAYLSQPSYAAAARTLPRPAQLGTAYAEGDFDILLIHRHHGILIGEIKSVGMVPFMTQAQADADVTKRVWKAVQQLDKSQTVVTHLVHDIAPGLLVRKTIILPFVDSGHLLRLLTADQTLNNEVCSCLGAATEAEATELCVCSDQLSDRAAYWKVTAHHLSQLTAWWTHRMVGTVDNTLTDPIYLDLVARFAGPATTMTIQSSVPPRLQIPTLGDAVSYVGDGLARLVLTPQQTALLQRAPPRVYLKGPPGTGKTVTLVLMGLHWLLQGYDVSVMCPCYENLAVSELICHQLRATAARASSQSGARVGRVRLWKYGLFHMRVEDHLDTIVHALMAGLTAEPQHIIVDEMVFRDKDPRLYTWESSSIHRSLESLGKAGHHIWMAGVVNAPTSPSFEEAVFTTPLRSAPSVLREMQPGIDEWVKTGKAQPYTSAAISSPSDGVQVIRLTHHGLDHTTRWPVDCTRCGHDMARVLRDQLHVGGQGQAGTQNCAAPLQYRDVLVATRSCTLHDDILDAAGNVMEEASGVVRGLRAAGLPLCVVGMFVSSGHPLLCRDVSDMALAISDHVTVCFSPLLQGLERKVVVWLPAVNQLSALDVASSSSDTLDRVHALSRCSTQLLVVHLPQPVEPGLD